MRNKWAALLHEARRMAVQRVIDARYPRLKAAQLAAAENKRRKMAAAASPAVNASVNVCDNCCSSLTRQLTH
jgi:hypothetical protein